MRISRPCYDKFHRCPGWIGGGMKLARVQTCPAGRLVDPYDGPLWWLRIHRCTRCDVIVLPHCVRWLDPSWLRFYARVLADARHEIDQRRRQRGEGETA